MPMPKYNFQLSGRPATAESWDPDQPLLYILRKQMGLTGPKFGCGLTMRGLHVAVGRQVGALLRHAGQPAGKARRDHN